MTVDDNTYEALIAAIRNGGKGTYALTPAFTTRKAHGIAVPVGSANLYAAEAQFRADWP